MNGNDGSGDTARRQRHGRRDIIDGSKLAFFPPTSPSYKLIITDDGTGLMQPFPHHENVDVLKLLTRRGTKIVVVYVRYPMATSSFLFSHGNAADIGQMYELFIELSSHLRVDLLG
ncbi:hypothetical protein CASFOL_001997 [Castilleja foliolosa]|uniref:Uncharacterized protein n=1 Tax=Castilleja foliolosa TaxID=1961234 RepID=A0ABD3EGK4_9LAMI